MAVHEIFLAKLNTVPTSGGRQFRRVRLDTLNREATLDRRQRIKSGADVRIAQDRFTDATESGDVLQQR